MFSINQKIKSFICGNEIDKNSLHLDFSTVNKKQKALLIGVFVIGMLALATAIAPPILASHQSWVQIPSVLTNVNWIRGGCALGGGILLVFGSGYSIKLGYDRYKFKKLALSKLEDKTLQLSSAHLLAIERNNAYQDGSGSVSNRGILAQYGVRTRKGKENLYWVKFCKPKNLYHKKTKNLVLNKLKVEV